jgi:hypothetical protein
MTAVEQLKRLHKELDLTDAADSEFDVEVALPEVFLLDAPLDVLHLLEQTFVKQAAVNEGLDHAPELLGYYAQFKAAATRPEPGEIEPCRGDNLAHEAPPIERPTKREKA